MKNVLIVLSAFVTITCLWSCQKDGADSNAVAPKIFENLAFNSKTAFFSTDGSMTAPVDSVSAKTMATKIDITFIYDYDYSDPGFMDPVARSKEWYWNQYNSVWLNKAVETVFYATALTAEDFDAAKADQSKIAGFLADSSVVLAPHSIFPTGACIGGRETANPASVSLGKGRVFGFKNVATEKHGLLYIRTDQGMAWPSYVLDKNTKVDIVREN